MNATYLKFCTKCNTDTQRNKKGGCKPCASARGAAWRAANPEKIKDLKATWRAANHDKEKASQAAWNAANPEKVKAIKARWCAANSEKLRAKDVTYRAANPEKVKAYGAAYRAANSEGRRARDRNRRARKRNADGTHTVSDINELMMLQRGKCACCRTNIKDGHHVDHVMPLATGGSNDKLNLQLLCPTCNLQKSAKHPIDFMQQKGFLL